MTDHSSIISAILAEWGDYSPFVEPEIFGTDDPSQIARNITEFCSIELGSAIDKCLFYQVSQGSVFGLHLQDDRRIVVKVHPPEQPRDFLAAVYLSSFGYLFYPLGKSSSPAQCQLQIKRA